MKKIVIITIVFVFFVAVTWLITSRAGQENSNTNTITNSEDNLKTEIPDLSSDISELPVNPVSLSALMTKEFNGKDLTLGRVLEENVAYTRHYITYTSGDLTISGILNIPKGTVPPGGWPILFLNHGYIDTSVYTNGRGLRREQDYLARQGYAILHSDYRDHAQSDRDSNTEKNVRLGYIEDVINAVYAVKNSDLDMLSKERFGMLGHSMGGGISQAVMVVKPDLIDAVVLYAPVSSNVVDSYNRWTARNSAHVETINQTHGSPTDNPEFWKNMSPLTFFDKVTVPVLIFHGTNDDSCEIDWSRKTRDALVEVGKDVELVEYNGELHEFGLSHNNFMQSSTKFFKDNI
ncbi:alpha/beta fold hydrolase [Candidatus Falkowbacteria bacterium]|nr:MAG: alpha/beta fold hydrolase [Candidatus Falkowbacteria bacterium]